MKKRKKKRQIPKKPLTKREKFINRIALCISLLFWFIGMLGCVEISEMDNNLSGVTFFFLFFAIGLLIAVFVGTLIEKRLPDYLKNDEKTYSVVRGSIFTLTFLLPGIANYYNRTYPLSKVNYETFKVVEKTKSNYRSSSYTYYLYVDINNEKERLLTKEEIWNSVNEYGYVKLGIATGGLGFKYVSEIRAY